MQRTVTSTGLPAGENDTAFSRSSATISVRPKSPSERANALIDRAIEAGGMVLDVVWSGAESRVIVRRMFRNKTGNKSRINGLSPLAGLVVAIAIPLVLAITFVVMAYAGISLQRISLGALIIALGLLAAFDLWIILASLKVFFQSENAY